MYKKSLTKPDNETLWEKALSQAKNKFRSENSIYARLFARKWYKEHGGSWIKEPPQMEDEESTPPEPRTELMEFEQYVDDTPQKDKSNKSKDNEHNDKGKNHYWFKEPLVDVSRPVLDEAGNVVGFHPCGTNTKEYQSSLGSYRTSYPRCMPRSKAMRMNAIEREKYMQTSRYFSRPTQEDNFQPQHEEDDEE